MITIIAAIGNNHELGKDNALIWHIPADLKRFKKVTIGHTIIMGRKTFESIGRPLPNRKSVIISRNTSYQKNGCEIVHSVEEAIRWVKDRQKVFIIGGAQIYREFMKKKIVDVLDITQVHENFEADVFFPSIDSKEWRLTSKKTVLSDQKNVPHYSFLSYRRISQPPSPY